MLRRCHECISHLQNFDRLFSRDGGEIVEELVKRLASFEIVEQILNRNTCTEEHRCSSEQFRIAMYDMPFHASQ
jgi:hypothetical protein